MYPKNLAGFFGYTHLKTVKNPTNTYLKPNGICDVPNVDLFLYYAISLS